MNELLFESPITVGIAGGFAAIVSGIIWVQTGYRQAMVSAIGLAALTALLVLISQSVETDREKLEKTLYTVAETVERNQLDAAIAMIHPAARGLADRARGELGRYKFRQARITGIKSIEVDSRATPKTAVAEFNVAVSLDVDGQPFNGARRFVRVYFLEHNGRWLVNNYEHFEPTAGFRESTPGPRNPMESWKP